MEKVESLIPKRFTLASLITTTLTILAKSLLATLLRELELSLTQDQLTHGSLAVSAETRQLSWRGISSSMLQGLELGSTLVNMPKFSLDQALLKESLVKIHS